jgi:hypothetical protein
MLTHMQWGKWKLRAQWNITDWTHHLKTTEIQILTLLRISNAQ